MVKTILEYFCLKREEDKKRKCFKKKGRRQRRKLRNKTPLDTQA
jgi:hypothetical protein